VKYMIWIIAVWMVIVFSGCSQSGKQTEKADQKVSPMSMPEKMAKTAQEAIDIAKRMETVKQKKDYLITQAKSSYNSEQFQEVVEIA